MSPSLRWLDGFLEEITVYIWKPSEEKADLALRLGEETRHVRIFIPAVLVRIQTKRGETVRTETGWFRKRFVCQISDALFFSVAYCNL